MKCQKNFDVSNGKYCWVGHTDTLTQALFTKKQFCFNVEFLKKKKKKNSYFFKYNFRCLIYIL